MVDIVVMVVNLSEYNQTLREEVTQNRMLDSLMVWNSLLANEFLQGQFVLWFNKYDLFLNSLAHENEKFRTSAHRDLSACFPDYSGKTADQALQFITQKFLSPCPDRQVKLVITNAVEGTYRTKESGYLITQLLHDSSFVLM